MTQLIIKALISGIIVAVVSEVAQRSTVVAAIIVSLPLTSILALAWLYADTRSAQDVQDLSWSILWVVVPSLVFFVALPVFIDLGARVPLALVLASAATAVAYAAYLGAARGLGFDL
jgi:uncharacterized membrane protein (GlpM family)